MPGLADLLNPGDPGIYPESDMYQPSPASGRAVPENWGDIIGGMLGQIGNISRARRNQEANMLLNQWEEAKSLGPEAMQKFLNNPSLPSWFREKVLGGITPDMIDPKIREKAQQIYTQVQNALKAIYDEAATIEDPDARDKFIDQKIAELRNVYPDWGSKLQTLPKGPDGHYALPGVQVDPFLDQIVIMPNGKPFINPATGKPYKYRDFSPAQRAKLEGDLVTRLVRQGAGSGQTLAQIAPQLTGLLKGTPYESLLNEPASSFLDENGEPDQMKIHNLTADAEAYREQKRTEQEREGTYVWANPKDLSDISATQDSTHTLKITSDRAATEIGNVERVGGKANAEARLRFNAKMNALKTRQRTVQDRLADLQKMMGNAIEWAQYHRPNPKNPSDPANDVNNPQNQVFYLNKARQLWKELEDIDDQMYKLSQEDPDLGINPPTPAPTPAPTSTPSNVTGNLGRYDLNALVKAIQFAEGVGTPKFDMKTWGPGGTRWDMTDPQKVAAEVRKYYARWVKAGSPGDFIQWMAREWTGGDRTQDWIRNVQAAYRKGAPTRAVTAGTAPTQKNYTHEDYATIASWMPDQIRRGLSFQAFADRVVKANPGIDVKRLRMIWDHLVREFEKQRKARGAYSGDPIRNTINWIWQHLQNLPQDTSFLGMP